MPNTLSHLSKQAAIVGVYEHPTRLAPDKSEWQLLAESAIGALDDAGLKPNNIDAFFTSATAPEGGYLANSAAIMMADYLNIHPKFIDETDVGGASYGYYLNRAVLGIQAGLFECALIAYGATTRSRMIPVGTLNFNPLTNKGMSPTPDAFEEVYGLTVTGMVAMNTRRYMHDHGVTSEQLAQVAVTMRKHASLNPYAMMREEITVDDVLSSRIIATPLHKLDCCIISDGGAAVLVASPRVASQCRKSPVWIRGFAESHMHHEAGHADWSEGAVAMVRASADMAFSMAQVGRDEIDMAMIYDPFTISVISDMEGLGFFGPDEVGPIVAEKGIELGGRLPVNPDGGGLSSNHPGRRGIFLFVEATRQLRGEAEGRQVPNCELVVCCATGAAFLARRASTVHVLSRS